ncbi:MAG: hypothetical protein Q8S55_11755 [Methylococcaceae bacterium]|nr:hypothetical protein [Methylococcaceae bacterium]
MDQQQKEVNPVGPTIEVKYIDLPQVPVMHPDKFADLIGLSAGVVGGWIDLGYVPTLKIGKYRMINLAAMTNSAMAVQS